MSRLSLLTQNTTNDLVVNIGDTANDRTGDPLRTAFNKIKDSISRAEQNFVELYATASADVQIPAQTNNVGKFLTTNGTTLSWSVVSTVADQLVNGNEQLVLEADGSLTLSNGGTIGNIGGTSFQATTGSGLEGDTKDFAVGGDVDNIDTSWTATGGGIVGTANITNVNVGLSFVFVTFDQSFTATGPITFTSASSATLTLSPNGVVNWSFEGNGNLTLPSNGIVKQNNSWTKTTIGTITSPSVVWTSSVDYISSAKLIIQVECDEVGDASGWHSQACEAIIACRGYANGFGGAGGDPQMSVYGVIHTSVDNLVTFSVQRNVTTNLVEVVGTLTATASGTAALRIHSVEMSTRD